MAETPGVDEDLAARERAVASPGSVLVQAPAGSGKTTLLTQRFLRLLSVVDAPERILALTFTRRAAQEMRERVIGALSMARLAQCPDDMDSVTWSLGVAAARHMEAAGIELERHPARLRIETIDAFNAWLAAQMPIAAGTGGSLAVDADPRAAYERAAARSLAYDEADLFGAAVERVLELSDQRWSHAIALIAAMLPSREGWLPLLAGRLELSAAAAPEHFEQVRRQFDEDLALLVARVLDHAVHALGAERLEAFSSLLRAAARRPGETPANLVPWVAPVGVLGADPVDLPRWRALAAIALTQDGAVRARLTKNEGFPPNSAEKARMLDLLAELSRDATLPGALRAVRVLPDPAYSDQQWERVGAVARVLLLAAAQLDQVFREQGSADFPAVSIAAQRALGGALAPTDLALRLDYRLQHILVDEFQDTSGAQLELLKLLTAGWQAGDGRSVFCVGDPMQSIYGFREAEVRAFLQLADSGLGEVRFDVQRLTSNYRSAQAVVDWVNASFGRILPREDDRERGAIAYRASRAARRNAAHGDAEVRLAGYATREAEAAAIADLIAARTAQHPEWHIAVLVRAKAHARELAAALRARGIAFRAVDLEPLQDRALVRDLITLARALLHQGDRTAWLAVLRAPWAGLELADLLILARAGEIVWSSLRDESVLASLSAPGRARCRRLGAVLEQAYSVRQHTSVVRWIERTWLALGGPACAAASAELEHARAAFERLRELEAEEMPDPAELDAAFDDLYAHDDTASAVEIMTIHKAKGLQFDLVILPALERAVSQRHDEYLLSRRFAREDREGLVIAARPPLGAERDPLIQFLRTQAREEAALEAERLLYVACTRAKWQLYLSAAIGPAAQPKSGSLLNVLWPVAAASFTAQPAATQPHNAADAAQEPRGGPLLRLPADWRPAPLAAPFDSPQPGARIEARLESPVFDWAGETARLVGSLVHSELQRMQLEEGAAAVSGARRAQHRRWLKLRGVPAARLEQAVERVGAALASVSADPRGRWILSTEHRDAQRELALSAPSQHGFLRVVFDRSFVDADGVRWIIDYKTSEHLGSGLEEFLDREVERYGAQMQRYATLARRLGPEPVRVGLYFPLMRAWREWRP